MKTISLRTFMTIFLLVLGISRPLSAFDGPQIPAGIQGTIVKCSVNYEGRNQYIELKMQAEKIIPWNNKTWGNITPRNSSIFYWFGQDRQESGIEFEKSFRAPNGYSILQLGTTADAVTIGVAPTDGKGFYSYQDNGSGNGNLKLSLSCENLE